MHTTQRLLLVDGSNYLYRAFHAMPELKNSQGFYTGALYGLISMLRKLKETYHSTYCVCVFDHKDKTFRHNLYPAYKANRSSMPQNLIEQLSYVDELVQALGWSTVKISGIEADDIIGTLANYAKIHMPVLIATGDKDMAQLVSENVHIIDSMKNTYMDIEGVKGKFDLLPSQIIDYLALMGDTSDNIKGVDKVGTKTAVKWLKQYNSLDNLLIHATDIKGVVGENLRNSLDILALSKQLVTINIECTKELDEYLAGWQQWRIFAYKDENIQVLHELFTKFEFKGWLKDLEKKINQEQNLPQNAYKLQEQNLHYEQNLKKLIIQPENYETITRLEQLKQWIALIKEAEIVSLDTETTSLNPLQAELVGISMAIRDTKQIDIITNIAVYIPIHSNQNGLGIEALNLLKEWLENPIYAKVGQNIKYDLHIFANVGIKVQGFCDDTMLASYILASHNSHNLDNLSRRYLNHQSLSYEAVCGKGVKQITFDQVDIKTATHYAAEDADITLHLHYVLQHQLQQNKELFNLYKNLECPLSHVLLNIERFGVLIDTQELHQQSREIQQSLEEIETKAYVLANQEFNLSSPKQVAEILFNQLKLPIIKKTSGGLPSTDEEVLTKLAHNYPLPKLLLEHRTLAKLKTTYTDKLPTMVNQVSHRVHTSFAQAVAITGRLSSNEPNLQNIPIRTAQGRKIRQAFIAPENHCLISADYSQIELRIMAHLSMDNGLIHAFTHNQDVHIATAKEIFNLDNLEQVTSEQRRYAKIINFGLIYGMSAFGVANNLGIDNKTAKSYIDAYFSRYSGVAQYMQQAKLHANQYGYVETIIGRRLYLPDITSSVYVKRQASERAAINAPMQGSAADIIKLAMLSVHQYIQENNLQSQILLQVHDELILQVPYNELKHMQKTLPNLMQNVYKLSVPLIVNIGIGDNWNEAH